MDTKSKPAEILNHLKQPDTSDNLSLIEMQTVELEQALRYICELIGTPCMLDPIDPTFQVTDTEGKNGEDRTF